MRRSFNKKAGEHSTAFSLTMVISLVIIIAAVIIFYKNFGGLSKGLDESKQQGICVRLLKARNSLNKVELFDAGPGNWGPDLGPSIAGSSLFYVSPACGNMYLKPCNTTADCQEKIVTNLEYCRKMQEAEPDVPRPCLSDLEINASPPVGATDLCKGNANVCGAGVNCVKASFAIPNSVIDYPKCPQQGASISMKYDKDRILVICQGTVSCT